MEILFRGFHKQEDGPDTAVIDGVPVRGRWVYGDLRQDKDLGRKYISGWKYYAVESEIEREPFEYEIIPLTVGQCTGLTDKNGKKIFVGDVVKHRLYHPPNTEGPELTGSVEFHKAAFSIEWSNFQEYGRNFAGYIAEKLEVICTIYEAPPESAP